MITTKANPRLQTCPLCKEEQAIIINGWIQRPNEDPAKEQHLDIQEDRGYSFCNCHNIFFTDFNKEFADIYTQTYVSKYNGDHAKGLVRNYNIYLKKILELMGNRKSPHLLEIGAATDVICEEGNKLGMWCTAFDIAGRESAYPFRHGNFENFDFGKKKFDIIFASHIFEHFRDPIAAVKKCHQLLNDGGFLFVAMPDPWFIDYGNPYSWGHWHLEEHHILWDMESFCDVAKDAGFHVKLSNRNTTVNFICILDMHLLFQKKIYE